MMDRGAVKIGSPPHAAAGLRPGAAKAAQIRCLFRYLPGRRLPAKSPQACWTSRGRFAKRRPLAVAVSGLVPGA
jgi:hypothetical protein